MPKMLQCILVCYRASLWLYPPDFRAACGVEMERIFEQDLFSEWKHGGLRAVLPVSCCAASEVFTVALPGWLFSERIIAPGLSLIITSALFLSLIAVMQDRALASWINQKFLFGGGR